MAVNRAPGKLMIITSDTESDEENTPVPEPFRDCHERSSSSSERSKLHHEPPPHNDHIYEDIDYEYISKESAKQGIELETNISKDQTPEVEQLPQSMHSLTFISNQVAAYESELFKRADINEMKKKYHYKSQIITCKKGVIPLLKGSGKLPGDCYIDFNENNNTIVIYAEDEDTMMTKKIQYYETVNSLCTHQSELTLAFANLLKEKRGQGFMLRKFADTNDRYVYIDAIEQGKYYLCAVAFSERAANDAIKDIQDDCMAENIPFTDGHIGVLGSRDWIKFVNILSEKYLVTIDVINSSNNVLLEGVVNDVKNATEEVKNFLKKHEILKPLIAKGGKASCVINCPTIQFKIRQLQKKIRDVGGSIEVQKTSDTISVTLSGAEQEYVKTVQDLLDGILTEELDIGKIDRKITDSDQALLCQCLQSQQGKEFIQKFEEENGVGIDIITTQEKFSQETRPTADEKEKDFTSSESDSEEYMIKIGHTTITVRQGNIVNEKAQVLVNFMEKASLWKYSTVAKNFIKLGGEEMKEDFKRAYDTEKSVTTTNSTGRLKQSCDYVCHVTLGKCRNDESKTYLERAINELYDAIRGYPVSSVALPAVGTGRILKYPVRMVAELLVGSAFKLAQEGKSRLQAITFVIYDESDAKVFCQQLKEEQQKLNTAKSNIFRALFGSSIPEVQVKSRKSGVSRTVASRGKRRRPSSAAQDTSSEEEVDDIQKVKIMVYADSKLTMQRGKIQLSKDLKTKFLQKDYIKVKAIKQLGLKQRKQIADLGKDRNVHIHISIGESKIRLKGEEKDLLWVSSKIKDILLLQSLDSEENTGRKGGWKPKHKKGTDAYWKELSENHTTAPYWKKFKPGMYLRNLLTKHTGEDRCIVYEVDSRTFQILEDLVTKTWDNTHVGQGKDAVGLTHQNLVVKKVERIENLDMRQRYLNERSALIRRLHDSGHNSFTPLQNIPGNTKGEILTTKVMDTVLFNDMHPELNEHYLFHGTKASVVDNIAYKGVDNRKGEHGMLGTGIYCAESSTKADQYADEKTNRGQQGLKMVLVRLLLGDIYVTATRHNFKHPPCITCRNDTCNTAKHVNHDSIVADGQWLFREFLVYDSSKCYPEYIITYDRV